MVNEVAPQTRESLIRGLAEWLPKCGVECSVQTLGRRVCCLDISTPTRTVHLHMEGNDRDDGGAIVRMLEVLEDWGYSFEIGHSNTGRTADRFICSVWVTDAPKQSAEGWYGPSLAITVTRALLAAAEHRATEQKAEEVQGGR
jgi:hypothetical protein